MRSSTWLRRRRRTLLSAGVLTVSVLAVTTAAVAYQGFPTTEVDLHDGGVWITKRSSVLVGHFNHESRVLDGGLRAASDSYDILQDGATVLVMDEDESTVSAVDPGMVMLTDTADVPGGAKVALGGPTMAVLAPDSGALWIAPSRAAGSFTAEGTDPVAELGAGADVAVGRDGTVYAVSSESREIVTVPISPEGEASDPQSRRIDGVEEDAELSITVVGSTAAVLDADSGTVYTSGGMRSEVSGAQDGVLQQPAASGDAVVLSTATDVVRLPFDGSGPTAVSSGADEGAPAAPVTLAGCTYAAWSGSGGFVRDCSGEANDLTTQIDDLEPTAELRFRQNRDVVVLNDVVGGAAWMATDALQRVDNWDDIIPPEGESEEDEQTTEETVETTLPERTEVNTPPIATDDEFGVRPGRTTVLPVLDNDTDADGDVLTVSLPDGTPALGEVQPIHDGSALQIAVPENASGTDSFRYEVDDGRGGTATATVRLSVRGWDVNAPPEPKRVTTVVVEAGGSITYNVLPDWTDPDGDEVFLASVVPADGDEADFTADGRITYRAIGGTQGRKDVPIIVSDGTEITEGIVRFDVRPPGSTVPVTNADHLVVRAGQTATVAPLANDTSAGREVLRLTRVDQVPGADIVPDYANKTFTFRSSAPGTYYAQYLVAAGPNAVPGLVRIDVLADADTDLPPVAVRDVALLPSGGDVLVNVLANDADPSGGILVVQSVTVEPSSGVSVAVLGHETLRITDQSALAEQTRISYRISNGKESAEGEVVVIPVPAPDQLRPPVANDDQAVVRAGDVVTIPVLDNDYHPNNDALSLAPELVEPLPAPEDGTIFISQDTVRFRASDEPGTVYATYEVADSSGQKDAGYLTIQVLPVDAETNQAPRPRDLTGRVLAGGDVRIPIPLDGLDPDGDSVELLGLDSAPGKGRVSEVGASFLTYEAFEGETGADAFTYRVRDRLGAEATATVRVGIAPGEAANQAPYAVKDAVVMRPDREVAVPVLANDSDPEGDKLTLMSEGLILPDNAAGLDARVVGDRVVVTSPGEPMETSLQYTIRDARGAEARAVLQVTVAEDVPLQKPIARDDRVRPVDVDEEGFAEIDILANDEDPDGTVDALELDVDAAGARVLGDGVVRLPILEERQLITYSVTDQDDLTASAFIHVPSLDDLPPVLISTEGIEVQSGETVQIPLSEHVRAAGDRDVVITEAAKVRASHANGDLLVEDQRTLVYTSADGFFGQDALTFEVTDGTGPDDPEGRKATLTLPVTVLPPDNQQPTFVNGAMDVAAGEDPTDLDLAALTTDPDEGDIEGMRYTIVGRAPAGMSASIDGQTLRVGADADVRKGTTAEIDVRVDDGETDPVEGTVTVRVTASTRPLPTANDDVIAEADQGREISVPVLANDFNPFPETPLEVVAAATETGEGVARVSGDEVSVTPGARFFGTMIVRYRIQDATGDPDREVEGRIRLTVQGKPDAPGVPTVSSVQDRTVVLSWTPPPNNGAAITGYTVNSTAGNYTKQCASTTCTLDGLTNNVEYNFTVTATNRVGESDPSAPSETARPDARPDTPQPPTLRFGDRSLNVTWVTPPTPGSPVESFTLEISPAPPSGITQKTATGNSLVWDGLENGTSYQVRVQAHNRAPEPSSWSAYSASEIPAGPPAAAAAPTTQRLEPVGSQAQLQVTWQAPAANGDPIAEYRLNVRGGESRTITGISPGTTSQAVVVPASATDYTFTVEARNKAGWGPASPPSAPRRAFTPPGAPGGVSASTPAADNSIHVAYQEAARNGADAGSISYQYSLNGGGWQNLSGNRITNVTNGQSYTVALRAVTNQDGTTYAGPPSNTTAAQTPYGPIRNPGANAQRAGETQITFSWSPPSPNGRNITKLEINIDGRGWENVAVRDGSRTVDFGYEHTAGIQVRATDAAGQTSAASAQARTANRPQPRAWISKGGSAQGQSNCSSSSCAYFQLNTENFPAGTYRVYCNSNTQGEFAGGASWSIPRDGRIQLGCYYGHPNTEVWVRIDGWGNSERFTWR